MRTNPFLAHADWYVDVERAEAVAQALHGPAAEAREPAYRQPTAVWIDTSAAPAGAERALAHAAAAAPPQLLVLVVYNLPNRDCMAKASQGELCCTRMAPGKPCRVRCDSNLHRRVYGNGARLCSLSQ